MRKLQSLQKSDFNNSGSIQMVDLVTQYERFKSEIDHAISDVLSSARYIKGPVVNSFESALSEYTGAKHVISCANGTDALQIALMALGCTKDDEIIVPSFTYVATAEVIALLGLTPVMVDVDKRTFNITAEIIEKAITPKTKAIVPVHLFGQNADMDPILQISKKHNLYVIEDNAQAIGAEYTHADGTKSHSGTIGHIGTTSFFPSKNLGCYGDGGAIFTDDEELAAKIRMISNHGQEKKYYHKVIGVNSRLDALQAAILNVKLKYLTSFCENRQAVALKYDDAFKNIDQLETPFKQNNSTHVYHQYTLIVHDGQRDALKTHLADMNIPSMIYYPLPLYHQEAFSSFYNGNAQINTEYLCKSVLSLPIHTEMTDDVQNYIISAVQSFF